MVSKRCSGGVVACERSGGAKVRGQLEQVWWLKRWELRGALASLAREKTGESGGVAAQPLALKQGSIWADLLWHARRLALLRFRFGR